MTATADMKGKVCIVTGANSGIGKETSVGLAKMGARVVMVCRNEEKGKTALEDVRRESGNSNVDLLIADISSQSSVRGLAKCIHEKYPRIDVLINNAGMAASPGTLSAEGIDMMLAANFVGPALLTSLLLDPLKASAHSRIINVSSIAHQSPRQVDTNNLPKVEPNFRSGMQMYGVSKLFVNAFTFVLARKLEGTGVTCNCLHPGVVATNIFGKPAGMMKMILGLMKPFLLDAKRGAEVSLWAATSPELTNVTGQYFVKCKVAESSALSRDPKVQEEIWQWTAKTIGQQPT